MAAALQVVPAGARHIGGNVYQLPRRRSAMGHHKKGGKLAKRKSSKHSFFAKQWVWYALALALADAIGALVLGEVAPWVSVPALVLFAYGKYKNKPGAMNAAYAIQGAHLLAYWGVTAMVRGVAEQHLSKKT